MPRKDYAAQGMPTYASHSDIDFLVDLDVRHRGRVSLIGPQDELEHVLGERVDVAPREALAPHVAE